MRTTLFLLVLLAGPVLAGQAVWKWVDADGVTHYSDRPVPGATRMEVSTGTSLGNPSSSSYGGSSGVQQPADVGPPYRNFEIWQPSNEETIPNTAGQVTVNVRVDPPLQGGHSLALYLDGRMVEGYAGNAQSFTLSDLPRGAHSLVAVITDQGGVRIQETSVVTFYVRQESAAQAPVGPSLRPPPKTQPRARNKLQTSQPTYAALNRKPTAPIDPATNLPVVTKPAANQPAAPSPRSGK